MPIDFIRDGATYLALNAGRQSNWYRNALANPHVTLEIEGKKIEACAENVPVNTSEQISSVLEAYERERPGMLDSFLGITADTPQAELMQIGEFVAFMRFYRVG